MEVVGAPATGKTQLCFSALTAASKIPESVAIFVDVGCSFDGQRIMAIAAARGLGEQELERIQVLHARDVPSLLDALDSIAATYAVCPRLVVLDSVGMLVAGLSGARGVNMAAHLTRALRTLVVDHACAILMTSPTGLSNRGPLWSAWALAANTRVLFERPIDVFIPPYFDVEMIYQFLSHIPAARCSKCSSMSQCLTENA